MGLDPAACYVDTAGPTARGLQECSNACPAHAELMLYTSRDHVDHKPFSSAPTPTDNNTHNIKVIIIKWYYTPIPLTPPSFLGGVFCHVMSCHVMSCHGVVAGQECYTEHMFNMFDGNRDFPQGILHCNRVNVLAIERDCPHGKPRLPCSSQ